MAKDFYVYLHRKATTGEVFYVGKGQGNRAESYKSRSKYWHSVVARHGLCIELMQTGMQEWWAFELERDLIALYGRKDLGLGQLTNLSDGGDGATGRIVYPAERIRQRAVMQAIWDANRPAMCEAAKKNIQRRFKTPNARKKAREHLDKIRPLAMVGMQDRMRALNANVEAQAKAKQKAFAVCAKAIVGFNCVFSSIAGAVKYVRMRKPKASESYIIKCCKGLCTEAGSPSKAYGSTWRYATPEETAALKEKGASWAPLSELFA